MFGVTLVYILLTLYTVNLLVHPNEHLSYGSLYKIGIAIYLFGGMYWQIPQAYNNCKTFDFL